MLPVLQLVCMLDFSKSKAEGHAPQNKGCFQSPEPYKSLLGLASGVCLSTNTQQTMKKLIVAMLLKQLDALHIICPINH